MTRVTVHEYAAALRPRYRAARKGSKGKILDEFCRTTGMHRKAAIRLLRSGVKLKPVRSRGPRAAPSGQPLHHRPVAAQTQDRRPPAPQAAAAGHYGPEEPGAHQDLERGEGGAARLPP